MKYLKLKHRIEKLEEMILDRDKIKTPKSIQIYHKCKKHNVII